MSRTYVIAEAGVNHNGSRDLARKLVDVAARAGADAVKFQTFRAEKVISRFAQKAAYQEKTTGNTESQLDMVKKLELTVEDFQDLSKYCREKGITFLSTPFDEGSVDVLVSLGVAALKIPSGEITNPLLLRAAAATNLPCIVSTGMSTLGEVEQALGVLAGAYLGPAGKGLAPSAAFSSLEGQRLLRDKVTLLHCTTEYPAPYADVNLRAMSTMHEAFGLPVGYSDHTKGIEISIAAVAMGATMIEKHFTLDSSMTGPDHRASLEPAELTAMVSGIRNVEASLGHRQKMAAPSEIGNAIVARKSLVASVAIRKGERFTASNLTAKRPGNGISPMRFDEMIAGRIASRDFSEDELIEE